MSPAVKFPREMPPMPTKKDDAKGRSGMEGIGAPPLPPTGKGELASWKARQGSTGSSGSGTANHGEDGRSSACQLVGKPIGEEEEGTGIVAGLGDAQ